MATTVNLGKLRPDFRGDWSVTTTYVVNDVVCYRTQQFICIQNTTAGVAPTNASFWTTLTSCFNNRGTWASGQSYLIGDVVVFNTPGIVSPTNANFTLSRSVPQAYYCSAAHTSSGTITPIDTGFWQPINRKSVLGTQSSVGATTGAYTLGVYSNSNYSALVFPNRGIAFENQSNYRGFGYKNTTDSVSAGFISTNGQCVTWGGNSSGSLGFAGYTFHNHQNALTFNFLDWFRSTSNNGTGVHSTPDNQMPRAIQWEKSSSGNCVLFNNGEVYAWGNGGLGENGHGDTNNYDYPVRVGGTLANIYNNTTYTPLTNGAGGGHAFRDVRIKRIAMSGGCGTQDDPRHTLALDENGDVWAWGFNVFGQLGQNNTTNYNVPQRISRSLYFGNQAVVAIWAFGNRTGWSAAVTANNNLYVWGYNVNGQLGVGDTTNRLVPTLVTTINFGSVSVGNVVKMQALDRWDGSNGTGCTAVLTSLGYIYTTGINGSGWMGNSNTTNLNTWTNVGSGPGTTANGQAFDMWLYGSGGARATLMVRDTTTTGQCWTAGYNLRGQLGIGGTSTTQSTIFVRSKIAIAGSLYDLTNVRQLGFCSVDDTMTASCVTDSGIAFSIGDNTVGQASNGNTGTFAGGFADSSGVENINSYAWQPVRAAPFMQGRMEDVTGFTNGTTFNLLWRNSDGRTMISGRSNEALTGLYSQQIDANAAMIMTIVPTN